MKQIIPVVGMALCALLWLHTRQTEAQPPTISVIVEAMQAEIPEQVKMPNSPFIKGQFIMITGTKINAITDKSALRRAGFKIQ